MPTRKEVSKIKADFIVKREAAIRSKISLQQEALYSELVDIFIDVYSKRVGKSAETLNSRDTLNVISQLEKHIKKFGLDSHPDTLKDYIDSSRSLGDLTLMYYSTMYDNSAQLEDIKVKTSQLINKKLGVNPDGTLRKNGFVQKMMLSKSIEKQIIAESRKAISNNYDLNTLKEKLKNLIVGNPELKQNGVIQRHYNTYAKDLLNSVSNNYSNMFAKELDLEHAIYAGGLIKTSHKICIENNGKIFTRQQIEDLRKDPRIVKMYGDNIEEYDPFTLPGGYGCLHSWDWITPDLAIGRTREQNKKASLRNEAFKDRNGL